MDSRAATTTKRQGDRPEAGEAGEHLLLLGCGVPLLLLDAFQGAYGGDNVAGLRVFAAGNLASRSLREIFRGNRVWVPARRAEGSAAV